MRALVPVLVAAALLGGCSGASGTAELGIAPRTAIRPEHRATCEALARVDLGVVGTDAGSLERSARALEVAALGAPADVQPALESLVGAYRGAAETPGAAAQVPTERASTDIVGWFNAHCGGLR